MRVQPKKIMCAVDFSDFTDEILAYSISLCNKFHAKLFLVHIITDVTTLFEFELNETSLHTDTLHDMQLKNAQKLFEDLVKEVTIEYEIVITKGEAADEIRRIALKEKNTIWSSRPLMGNQELNAC